MQESMSVTDWQSFVWAPSAQLGGAVSLWDHARITWELCLGNCPQLHLGSSGAPSPEVMFEAGTLELCFWVSRAPQNASTPVQRVME